MNVQKNAVEWTVFALAAIIVLASVGGLVFLSVQSHERPPELEARALAPQRTASGFVVPVQVRNKGDRTAEAVHVEVSLKSGEETVERSEMTFDYLPRHSEREGSAIFSRDPQCCSIEARTTAFDTP